MRAIKIDSINRTVTEVEINSLHDTQEIVGGLICLAFDYPDEKTACFINDEGLLHNPQYFFSSMYARQPFAGNAIIVGMNRNGDTVPCKLSVQEVLSSIKFFTLKQIQWFIRKGIVNYNTYITTSRGTELISKLDLGAFDNVGNDDLSL